MSVNDSSKTLDARVIANAFLDLADRENTGISLLKLLKLVYIAHAYHLLKFSSPLISNDVEAWKYGPVVAAVFNQFKGYPKQKALKGCRAQLFNPDLGQMVVASALLTNAQRYCVDEVFEQFARVDDFKLSAMTHGVGGPWHRVWTQSENEANLGMVIPNDLIREFFPAEPTSRALH